MRRNEVMSRRLDEVRHQEAERWRQVVREMTNALADERDRTIALTAALREAEEVFAMSEAPALPDPLYHAEVKVLGERIGFGALMATASAGWREVLEATGWPSGGEFVPGPCMGTVRSTLTRIRSALAAQSSASQPGIGAADETIPPAPRKGEG